MTKKEYNEVEAFVLGSIVEKQLRILIERQISVELKTELEYVSDTKSTVEIIGHEDSHDCDMVLEVSCDMCRLHADNPVILTDNDRADYSDSEILNELGIVEAVKKHFKKYHPVYYEEFIARTKKELEENENAN